jgi:hypothetical protein
VEVCVHLGEILAAGDVWSDETPAQVCGLDHNLTPRLLCVDCGSWHVGGHRPERSTGDGCGDRVSEWRFLDLVLRGVWVALGPDGRRTGFGDCLVRMEPATGLCGTCAFLAPQENIRRLVVEAPER